MLFTKVCISGLTATGLTTIATILAERHKLYHVSASSVLLDLTAKEHECVDRTPDGYIQHFWGTKEAQAIYWDLFEKRKVNLQADRLVDELLLEELSVPRNSLVESLTSSLLAGAQDTAFHIRLRAPLAERVRRVNLQLPHIERSELTELVLNKDVRSRDIVEQAWGVDISSKANIGRYDLVINDAGFKKLGPNFSTRESQIELKSLICSAFIQAYEDVVVSQNPWTAMSESVIKCRQILSRFRPLIYSYPRQLVEASEPSFERWRSRRT